MARLAAAVQADLQPGVPHEVRAKALRALGTLPGHRLEAVLAGGGVLERLVSAPRLQRAVVVGSESRSLALVQAPVAAAWRLRPCALQQACVLGGGRTGSSVY